MPHKDPEAARAYQATYYAAHREKKLSFSRTRYEADRGHARENERAWRSANPELARLHAQRHNANQRAKRLGIPGRLSIEDVRYLLPVCVYCGATEKLTLDHATPLSRGGANAWHNLTVACRPCNRAKWNRTVAEFLAERAA